MVGLLDIANAPKELDFDGQKLMVRGVSANDIASIMSRFPIIGALMQMRKEMQSAANGDNEKLRQLAASIKPGELMRVIPEAIAAIIAAGCGHLADRKYEEAAASLPVGIQVEIFSEIFDKTFPKGVGPFVARLEAFGMTFTRGREEPGKAPTKL